MNAATILALMEALAAMGGTDLREATWNAAYINDLPDSAFLVIEDGGEKEDGKTTPRSLRHFPVKGDDGKVDLPHLRNALARIPQSKLSAELKASALKKARALAKTAGVDVADQKEGTQVAKRNARIIEAADTSLNERMRQVQQAVSTAYNSGPGEYSYVEVVFDDYVVICKGGKLWKVAYTVADDGTVALAGEPIQVRQTYTPVSEGVLIGPVTEAGESKPSGKKWGVIVIEEGMSKNRNRYQRKVLQEAAPLYEGASIYMDHEETPRRYGRSTRDKAGFLKSIEGVLLNPTPGKEATSATFGLAATAVVTKSSVRQEMLEAWEEGNPNLFGLSHDVTAESTTVMGTDGAFYDVQRIEAVSSVDFVTNPAAGGRVLRLVASDTVHHTLLEDGRMLQKMIEAIKASGNQALIAKLTGLGATPTEDQVMGIYTEAIKAQPAETAEQKTAREAAEKAAADKATKEAEDKAAKDRQAAGATQITEAGVVAQLLESTKDGRMSFLENQLGGTALHQPVKDALRAQFEPRIAEAKRLEDVPTKAQITEAVKAQVDLFAKLAEGNIVMPATGLPRVEIVKGRREKVEEQLNAFMGLKKTAEGQFVIDPSARAVSFRNIYIDITGDVNVTGRTQEAKKLTESLDTSSFDQILGDSITRRMVAEYQLETMTEWRGTIAEVVPVSDFRTQRRMRFGGYGNLQTVTQGNPYPSMTSPTDEEATYAPAKRGGTEQLTIEMIANDDVGAIRRIPTRLSRAAYQTLREFVFDFMATNAVIYDGNALFTSGGGSHLNLITSALSASNVSALRLLLKKQTDMSNGKRIGLKGRYLWLPTDLEELGYQITGADRAVPDTNVTSTAAPSAPNFVRAQGIQPRVVDYWTDATDYFLTADVSQTPMIELGFWGGEDPQLLVQDQPNVGSLFSNDAITYRIRHVYGGAVLDFRGFAASIQ